MKIDQDKPDFWNMNYAGSGFYQDRILGDHRFWQQFIDDIIINDCKPRIILEFGCGVGMCTKYLKAKGYDITGIDYSQVAIHEAQRRYRDYNDYRIDETFKVADIRTYRHDQKVDDIICFEVLEHFKNPIPIIQNICKNLRSGGRLIFSVPRKGGKYADIDEHLTIFDHERLVDMLSPFFNRIEFYINDILTRQHTIYGMATRR